jgi:hypothetical protein
LWNSPFAIRRAESAAMIVARDIAADLRKNPNMDVDDLVASRKLENLYARVLGRAPAEHERHQALAFLASQALAQRGGAVEPANKQEEARERAWRDLAQALMASNEFLYLE